MQTAILETTKTATEWEGLPYWLRLVVGFLLIGVGASILATQLRAAFPSAEDPPKSRALHHLYAPFFGAGFASAAWFFLPGFGWDSRWLIGLVAPFLWGPVYDFLRARYEKQFGVSLAPARKIAPVIQIPSRPTPPGGVQ